MRDIDDDHDDSPGPTLTRLHETKTILGWISGVHGFQRPDDDVVEKWKQRVSSLGFDVSVVDALDGFYGGVNVFEYDDDSHILMSDAVIDFDVALDLGCVDHVCAGSDAPGVAIKESAGSSRGQNFVVGNGDKIPNQGQVSLPLEANVDKDVNHVDAIFQVAKVTRPLMSVSRICDGGFTCHFDDKRGVVKDKSGKVVCVFDRRGGLYICNMKLRSPFTGRGR